MSKPPTLIHDRDSILALLHRSPVAVEAAMVALYHLQTQDEQDSRDTRHLNGQGFSAAYAKAGTRYARWAIDSAKPGSKWAKPAGSRIWGLVRYGSWAGKSCLDHARHIATVHVTQLVASANEPEKIAKRVTAAAEWLERHPAAPIAEQVRTELAAVATSTLKAVG